ncbi:TPA: hypothetical protein P0E36_004889 [Vibrio harveyi]|nr:hypothetical protein [Vibrio harveyi]
MDLKEAIETITADLVGIASEDYYTAFMLVAFSKQDSVEVIAPSFSPEAMRHTLAVVLADQIGVSHEVMEAAIHCPLDVKAICARNYVIPRAFINSKLSRAKAPLDNYRLAAAILAFGPESPRFGDAMAYIIEEGNDVPEEVRNDVTEAFKQAAIEENLSAEQLAAFS